jgi:hypothetical protein
LWVNKDWKLFYYDWKNNSEDVISYYTKNNKGEIIDSKEKQKSLPSKMVKTIRCPENIDQIEIEWYTFIPDTEQKEILEEIKRKNKKYWEDIHYPSKFTVERDKDSKITGRRNKVSKFTGGRDEDRRVELHFEFSVEDPINPILKEVKEVIISSVYR